ncbi:MAG: type VI secretion system contractile sheath large subunit [Deltaproteobacteria bacterium]|nr:type VI secretion system contractile sheath large subunit [Deltaproteobacteria bacterium]
MTDQEAAVAQSAEETAGAEVSLLDEILKETKFKPQDEAYGIAKQGVQAFITEMLKPTRADTKVDRATIDAMIAELDGRISVQLNEILHHEDFQKLESSWRTLKFMVERIDFRENIKLDLMNVSKEDLASDLDDAPDLTRSGLYRLAYSNEYGQFGGQPYGVLCANYDFGPSAPEMRLLTQMAAVAAVAHAPLITNAAPSFFGNETFEPLPRLKDIKAMLEGPQFTKWHAFRESPDACYVGMCMPRFLLRLPWGGDDNPVKAFNFSENVVGHHNRYLWGHASAALVSRISDSFAQYRWCPNIIGPQSGGTVPNLPLHHFDSMGEIQTKVPTEIMLTERREFELSEEGFIALTFRKDSDNACFFSANSAQKPKFFGNTDEGKAAETNYRLGTQLPYMFVITRLAHYIKVMQREQIGSWKERQDLERELNQWMSGLVSDMENPAPVVRSRRPLRKAAIHVEDVAGQPGWYTCKIEVQPHIKYMGASFTLSLVGRLDK